MDFGKVLCLTACSQVYPTLSEVSHSVQGTGSNNHFNTNEASLRESTTNVLFLSILSVKLNPWLLPAKSRALSDAYFSLSLQGILGIMGILYGER